MRLYAMRASQGTPELETAGQEGPRREGSVGDGDAASIPTPRPLQHKSLLVGRNPDGPEFAEKEDGEQEYEHEPEGLEWRRKRKPEREYDG